MKAKLFLMLFSALVFTGCSTIGTQTYYVLSTPSQTTSTYSNKHSIIGVEKVILPKYLFKREIAVAKSASQIRFLRAGTWAEELDEGLTHRLVAFLQKKFNQPTVYAYPWDVSRQPDLKVKVQISRFIAQDNRVYLDATWEVKNMHTLRQKAGLFSTSVPTASDASSIVSAMHKAFSRLEERVASAIKNGE